MKSLSARIGLVAATATIALLLYRLVGATAPVPTPIFMSSESAALVSVDGVEVDGRNVLPDGWTPGRDVAAAPSPQAAVALRVGRPVNVRVRFALPRAAVASCTLEPRPYGECSLRLRFVSPADLRCEFECASAASRP